MSTLPSRRTTVIAVACILSVLLGVSLLPPSRRIGTKRLLLTLPKVHAHNLSGAAFYECYGNLDEILSSQCPEDDFARVNIVESLDENTVLLHLTVTGANYSFSNRHDTRYEPTFVLVIIEDLEALKPRQLLAQNVPGVATAIAVALDNSQ